LGKRLTEEEDIKKADDWNFVKKEKRGRRRRREMKSKAEDRYCQCLSGS
jgi:hypothetical protein